MTRDRKAELVLARMCDRLGHLGKTRAVKLPYLADVIAGHVLGQTITLGVHETWKHGVVCRPLYELLTHGHEGASPFHVEPLPWAEDAYEVSLAQKATSDVALSANETAIVDFVADEYASMTATKLGQLTKRLNPSSRWGENERADVGEDAYDRLTPGYQEMADTVDALDLDRVWEAAVPIADPRDAV